MAIEGRTSVTTHVAALVAKVEGGFRGGVEGGRTSDSLRRLAHSRTSDAKISSSPHRATLFTLYEINAHLNYHYYTPTTKLTSLPAPSTTPHLSHAHSKHVSSSRVSPALFPTPAPHLLTNIIVAPTGPKRRTTPSSPPPFPRKPSPKTRMAARQ